MLLACSPRANGNSDAALRHFAGSLADAGGARPAVIFLRDVPVLPCVSCGACERLALQLAAKKNGAPLLQLPDAASKAPERPFVLSEATRTELLWPDKGKAFLGCPLSRKDGSTPLLQSLALAPWALFVVPMYFCHMPAHLKAVIDRLQAFWVFRDAGLPLGNSAKIWRSILIGARTQGKTLFDGTQLSLRYAALSLDASLADPVLLYGLDKAGDLAQNGQALAAITAYAQAAAKGHD